MPKMRVEWKERKARIPREQQEEETRIASIPKELAFRLANNALVLLNAENDAEFARETPADLFGKETVLLQGLAAWEGRCWVGSDHGLLRFEPQTSVWSRFAVDRTHLSVPITGIEIVDAMLLITYGEGQSARFDLQERRWELALAAIAPAQNTTSDAPRLSWWFVIMLAVLTLGLGGLLRRGRRKAG
ncbi:MAG: hypothetical protein ACI8W8_001918 [Rhodothermales bacterium]|jgi:hypothetical protein